MYLSPRHEQILEVAKIEERVLVDDLAARFEVTPQTIRKDLNDLVRAKTADAHPWRRGTALRRCQFRI